MDVAGVAPAGLLPELMLNPATRAALTARTALRLGLRNVAAVGAHRMRQLRTARAPGAEAVEGPLFSPAVLPLGRFEGMETVVQRATRIARGELQTFGERWVSLGVPYAWDANVLGDSSSDIKGVWEASRFIWAVDLARAHRVAPDQGFLDCLELYARDWLARNPPFLGRNWECGQEAAIRLLHLLLANVILTQGSQIQPAMARLVELHGQRIERTLGYAVAQDNNHGTSEAAGLFVAGAALLAQAGGATHPAAGRWRARGRETLERLAARLIMADGGFSQYSVNYHRLLLDTLSQAELWRRQLDEPRFSAAFYGRCAAAVRWLGRVSNAHSGQAPNLGHNDGAWLYQLGQASFADQRPSLALASALFLTDTPRQESGRPGDWLAIATGGFDDRLFDKSSQIFPDWGLALLNPRTGGQGSYAFVRYPVRRFRPAQADMLHFDLWTEAGENLLIDAGSFSYADPEAIADYAGVEAHNTMRFDGGQPMRRLGRFLYADWPQVETPPQLRQAAGEVDFRVAYSDYRKIRHERRVHASGRRWVIEDHVRGFRREAAAAWHLPAGDAQLTSDGVRTPAMTIRIASPAGVSVTLEETFVSPTYGVKKPALVLRGHVSAAAAFVRTVIELDER